MDHSTMALELRRQLSNAELAGYIKEAAALRMIEALRDIERALDEAENAAIWDAVLTP